METVLLEYYLGELVQLSEQEEEAIQEAIIDKIDEYCDENDVNQDEIKYTTSGPIIKINITH